MKAVADEIRNAKVLSEFVDDLNANFALDHDLPIVFRECEGEQDPRNAFYDSKSQQITICYEFIQYLADGFETVYDTDDEANTALTNAITFFFFHELGHALVDLDHLPAHGEAAADEFATFVLLELLGNEGETTLAHAAVAFSKIVAEGDSLDSKTLGDEHPPRRTASIQSPMLDLRTRRQPRHEGGGPESRPARHPTGQVPRRIRGR